MNVESTMCITKPCTQLHPPPPSSLQQPQQYSNQNTTRNWTISPNLGRKIQSCPFWLKIGSHGISEVLIPNPDSSRLQNSFLGKFGLRKSELSFCLKIGTHGISRMLVLILTLNFWIYEFIFVQIWAKKVKVVRFVWKSAQMVSRGC